MTYSKAPHTVNDMLPAIGATVAVRFESITVACRVTDAKKSWNVVRLQVEPLQGSGSQWVELPRIVERLGVDSASGAALAVMGGR